MRPLHWLLAPLRAARRFLDWVYAPDTRAGPSRGEAIVHLWAAGAGHDSTRWMEIETEERRRRSADIRRVR
jgi:hypothetical protein